MHLHQGHKSSSQIDVGRNHLQQLLVHLFRQRNHTQLHELMIYSYCSSIRQGVGVFETRFRSFHHLPHLGLHYFITGISNSSSIIRQL